MRGEIKAVVDAGRVMVATTPRSNLWQLVWGRPQVDPNDLADAISTELHDLPLDFRTRLLIRDSLNALERHWGESRLAQWIADSPDCRELRHIRNEDLGEPGFPSLQERLMEKTDPETIKQFLRELGLECQRPVTVYVGGSAALILPVLLERATEDVDIVDEVPSEIRNAHEKLAELKRRYGLHVGHFQSHYLPMRWLERVRSIGGFGQLRVFLVDPTDVFLSKLFSEREKDRDDLRVLAKLLPRETIVRRLREDCKGFIATPIHLGRAQKNWYILFGEPLPIDPQTTN